MHGEKLQQQPPGRRLRRAEGMTSHGPGTSRKTASARPSISAGKPSAIVSRCVTVTHLATGRNVILPQAALL
jgi:hypothetical protein